MKKLMNILNVTCLSMVASYLPSAYGQQPADDGGRKPIEMGALVCSQFNESELKSGGAMEIYEEQIVKPGSKDAAVLFYRIERDRPAGYNSVKEISSKGVITNTPKEDVGQCISVTLFDKSSKGGSLSKTNLCYDQALGKINDKYAPQSTLVPSAKEGTNKEDAALVSDLNFCFKVEKNVPKEDGVNELSSSSVVEPSDSTKLSSKCPNPRYRMTQWIYRHPADGGPVTEAALDKAEKTFVDICPKESKTGSEANTEGSEAKNDESSSKSSLAPASVEGGAVSPLIQADRSALVPRVLAAPSESELKEKYKFRQTK
jgi:hypothetical protein